MNQNKRYYLFGAIVLILVFFLSFYRLPYYVYQPGSADALNPIVAVDDGFESEGDMHLVTVRGGPATAIQYALAKIRPFHEVYKKEEIYPEGVSNNEYMHAQLQLMESSQEAATVVAYKAAEKELNIEYKGVYVMSVMDDVQASDVLKIGDRIIKVDNQPIKKSEDLLDYVKSKEVGDEVEVTFERKQEKQTKTIEMVKHPDEDRAIIGITLVTDRDVVVEPPVNFSSGEIGGPSAGLMFSLEIYDQLTEQDITKGYQLAGTGSISYEGEVGRIGGIDQKVVAADKDGVDIFFAPNEGGEQGSNYQVAKQTAEEIGTDMKVVPVDTFDDALHYLEGVQAPE
ncbi:SepM family pheromone-processing serine protease [Pontibacillus salicampi]|uniref:endopeptidase La n=1 Tax=Pontibacillus salicampi TaxID=1449801 RepID=A0ABV6LNQ6_9BACI